MLVGASCVRLDLFKRRRLELGLQSQNGLDEIAVEHRTSRGRLPSLADPTRDPTGQTILGLLGVSLDQDVDFLSCSSQFFYDGFVGFEDSPKFPAIIRLSFSQHPIRAAPVRVSWEPARPRSLRVLTAVT